MCHNFLTSSTDQHCGREKQGPTRTVTRICKRWTRSGKHNTCADEHRNRQAASRKTTGYRRPKCWGWMRWLTNERGENAQNQTRTHKHVRLDRTFGVNTTFLECWRMCEGDPGDSEDPKNGENEQSLLSPHNLLRSTKEHPFLPLQGDTPGAHSTATIAVNFIEFYQPNCH
jgi:hypothetical protein